MTISGWQFRAQLWPTIAAILIAVVTLQLGNWQLSRAQEKDARQEQLEQFSQQPAIALPATPVKLEDFQYRLVEVHGVYEPAHMIYLDNKINQGVAGYQIIMPFRLGASSMYVLINRGWVATGPDRTKLPQIATPVGQVTVTGVAVSPAQRTLELSEETIAGQVWENLHLEKYRTATKLSLQSLVILQQNEIDDGLVRRWERPDAGSSRNIGYAFQWFAMSLTTVIIYLVLSVKRDRSKKPQA